LAQWLFEAKKRYGLSVLTYMVTSNHNRLLVIDVSDGDVFPNSIPLIARRRGEGSGTLSTFYVLCDPLQAA
jgi:putative transposase